MATKIICDRCGNEIKSLLRKRILIKTIESNGASSFDLKADACEKCSELVFGFIRFPEDGNWLAMLGLVKQDSVTPIRKFKQNS